MGKSIGISYPIFIVIALVAAFSLAWSENTRPARRSLVLSGLVGLLALVTILRDEPFTRIFSCRVYAMGKEKEQAAWQSSMPARVLARQRLVGLDLKDYPIVEDSGGRHPQAWVELISSTACPRGSEIDQGGYEHPW